MSPAEEVTKLKEERTKLKRKIKTIISAIDKIVGSSQKENLDKVTKKQSALPDLIEQFEEVHSKLIEKLDEEEIDGAERYRAELLGDYESCDDAAKVWIEKVLNEKDNESDKLNNTNDAEEKLDSIQVIQMRISIIQVMQTRMQMITKLTQLNMKKKKRNTKVLKETQKKLMKS